MDHIREAIAARQGLDNTIHFDRRSRLIVDFSPTRELSVTGFSRYSRDYTQFDDNGRIIGNAPSRSRSEREEKRRKKDPRDDNPVLLVSNFDEETTTMDVLFNLFSVYGNVIRIKILFGKRDSALIQFETSAFAQNARRCMDNLKLLGKKIRVTTSKYSEIAMPAPEDEEKHLTKEFLNAKYHRYRGESESYQKNLIQPTEVLHVSGVRDITEDQLREAFSNIGTVVKVKKLENHPTMALLEMENTEKAVEALVKLHLTEISGNAIRIAFSPNKVD